MAVSPRFSKLPLIGDERWPQLWRESFAVRTELTKIYKHFPGTDVMQLPPVPIAERPPAIPLEEALGQCTGAKAELDRALRKVAAHFDLPVLNGEEAWGASWPPCAIVIEPKSTSRAKEKGRGEAPRDLVRGSVLCRDTHELCAAYALIAWLFQLVKVKNYCERPTTTGFRFVLMQVILPETKFLAEVQLAIAGIKKSAKEARIHERFYSKFRKGGDAEVDAVRNAFEAYELANPGII